jgi:hypothetical protein
VTIFWLSLLLPPPFHFIMYTLSMWDCPIWIYCPSYSSSSLSLRPQYSSIPTMRFYSPTHSACPWSLPHYTWVSLWAWSGGSSSIRDPRSSIVPYGLSIDPAWHRGICRVLGCIRGIFWLGLVIWPEICFSRWQVTSRYEEGFHVTVTCLDPFYL